jgi:histidinol-phosphatase (PHP family)
MPEIKCRTNFHTHSSYCDGKSGIEEMITQAIELNYTHLGFSSHAPVPFYTPWALAENQLDNYFADLDKNKLIYQDKIKIYSALEIDYLSNLPNRIHQYNTDKRLDYTIGAIHFLDYYENGEAFDIAGKPHLFNKGLTEIFDQNKKKLVNRYFELLNLMIEQKPSIIAHLDFLKNQNKVHQLFNETDPWYRTLILDTFQNIKKNNCILEINTRGIYKGRIDDFYPSETFFPFLRSLNIPTIISTDAHHISELDALANIALQKAIEHKLLIVKSL